MPRLVLMRHAKSSWDDPFADDHARPLNKRGYASAKAMGEWLRERKYVPDEVISSTSKRTGETFIELSLDITPTFTRRLYHAGSDQMMEILRKAQGGTVLMLGHNPGIADFAERLLARAPVHPRFFDYPTCATLVAEFAEGWADLRWKQGRALDFAIPREVLAHK